jgi:hypothetical protein
MMRGCGAAAGGKRKREAGGWSFCREAGRRGGGERAGESRGRGRSGGRGKLTGGTRPSAAREEGRRGVATDREAGLGRVMRAGSRGKREREKGQLGRGCVGRWAGGPRGVLRDRFLDVDLNSLFKFKSHTIESNKSENPIQIKCINPSKPRSFTIFFEIRNFC